jgi:hypothetical protein
MRGLLGGSAPLRGRAKLELLVRPFDYREAAGFWGVLDDPELGDAAFYHAVLAAICSGSRKRSDIARSLGRPDSALSHPLGMLERVQLVRKVDDALRSRRPVYQVTEPLVRLQHLIIRPAEARFGVRGGRAELMCGFSTGSMRIAAPTSMVLADTAVLTVDEQADATNKRIIDVPGVQDTRPESERSCEEDDNSERAILKFQVRGKKPSSRRPSSSREAAAAIRAAGTVCRPGRVKTPRLASVPYSRSRTGRRPVRQAAKSVAVRLRRVQGEPAREWWRPCCRDAGLGARRREG